MTNYKLYYEGYDSTGDISLTKLHKNKENTHIEMLEKLGVSDEE